MPRKKQVPVEQNEITHPSAETVTQDPALAMILSHMELMAREQRQLAASVGQLKVETDERLVQALTQLEREKAAALDGLTATMELMWKNFEEKVGALIDQSTLNKSLERLSEEQEKLALDKQAAFQEALLHQPNGQIINYTAQTIPLTINRVTYTIRPGVNLDIPAPFVELWADNMEATREGTARNAAVANKVIHTDAMDQWRDGGKVVGISGNIPS